MKTRLIMFLISMVGLLFIVNISRSIYDLWLRHDIVAEREEVKNSLKKENEELQKELARVQSPEYIEDMARDKLNLQKEGEVVVVLPEISASPEPQTEITINPNWKKWWKLFF